MGSVVALMRETLGPLGIVSLLGSPSRVFSAVANLATVAADVHKLLSSICASKCRREAASKSDGGIHEMDTGLTKLLVDGGDLLTDGELRHGFLMLYRHYFDTDGRTAEAIVREAVSHVRCAYRFASAPDVPIEDKQQMLTCKVENNCLAPVLSAEETALPLPTCPPYGFHARPTRNNNRRHGDTCAIEGLARGKGGTAPSCRRLPTLLILGNGLHGLPWEAALVPGFTAAGVYARARSLAFALEHGLRKANCPRLGRLSQVSATSIGSAKFVVNPRGDLLRTEQVFGLFFSSCSRRLGWSGVKGRAPTKAEFLRAHRTPLFIFMGHGSGAEFASRESIADALNEERRRGVCGVVTVTEGICEPTNEPALATAALLFGCASGAVSNNGGECDPSGHVDAYLLGGVDGVLAFLWPVTDRDVDRMAARVMRYWMGHLIDEDALNVLPDAADDDDDADMTRVRSQGLLMNATAGLSLPVALGLARADAHAGLCRLPFLTSAGCIVYGDFVSAIAAV